jgi:hypothetical protein
VRPQALVRVDNLTLSGPEVALERVVGDPELATRAALVVVAALEHHARVPAAPCPQRLEPAERRHEHFGVSVEQ